MLHAENLWDTIDEIAKRQKLSLPALALSSGLDQSTFSRARRKRNWPSLQTISKVLNTYDIPIEEWAKMVVVKNRPRRRRNLSALKARLKN